MSLNIGIVGLPNVGKSTLFNALIRSRLAAVAPYPFCTIKPNIGVVEVPDERLKRIAEIIKPPKIIPVTIEFKDIAGLIKDAHKGEGLGNQFLSHIRESDAIIQIVRFFEDDSVTHVHGEINPKKDREIIEAELVLADMQTLEKRFEKTRSEAKSGKPEAKAYFEILERVSEKLSQGTPVREMGLSAEELEKIRDLYFITQKPVMYIANVSEEQIKKLGKENLAASFDLPKNAAIVPICAKIEEELSDLSPEEAKEYLSQLGLPSTGLDEVISSAYSLLGLITFFTHNEKELRAWTVRSGATAQQAAGVIHTDFEKHFIKAEVIAYDDFISSGGEVQAAEKGLMRVEGKDYIVRDGDIIFFRVNA